METLRACIAFGAILTMATSGLEGKDQPGKAKGRPKSIVGAIRWDAWHGDAGLDNVRKKGAHNRNKKECITPGMAVERSLGPKHWHYRLPFYAKVVGENKVEARANTQAVADREIEYAHAGGLDYFAFLTYDPDGPMSLGLKLYLSSKKKSKINFCVILHHIKKTALSEEAERILGYLKDPQYQMVLDGRPLIYMLRCKAGKGFYDDLRKRALAAGLKKPYFVQMEGNRKSAAQLGFDAVSSYTGRGGIGACERWRKEGAKVVPAVSSGWDRRPRVQNPVPWEGGTPKPVKGGPGPGTLSPAKIAARVKAAVEWNAKYPKVGEANAVIIYAWNEFDEGGWLCPTKSEGTARLDAIRKVLDAFGP